MMPELSYYPNHEVKVLGLPDELFSTAPKQVPGGGK